MSKKKYFRLTNQNLEPLDKIKETYWLVKVDEKGRILDRGHTNYLNCTGNDGDYVGIHTECIVLDIDEIFGDCNEWLGEMKKYTYHCKTNRGYHFFFKKEPLIYTGTFMIDLLDGVVSGDFRGQGRTFLYIKEKYSSNDVAPLPDWIKNDFKAKALHPKEKCRAKQKQGTVPPATVYMWMLQQKYIIAEGRTIDFYYNVEINANNNLNVLLYRILDDQWLRENILKNDENIICFIEWMNDTMDDPIDLETLHATVLNSSKFERGD